MALNSIFKLREYVTPQIIALLEQTTLGTNGAMYRHLDTSERILEADDPLFLSMERNDKVIGNITFCRRNSDWYIRYFAFHSLAQAGEKKKKEDKGNSLLKRELNQFFEDAFLGHIDGTKVRSLYAYIDPKNDRSKWMSENFNFHVLRQLATQTYSRVAPKASKRLRRSSDWKEIEDFVKNHYADHSYFCTSHAQKPPFYTLYNDKKELIACAKVTSVQWEIIRLPGKFGNILTKIIPFIPFLNRLIKPKNHTFLVPEIVCVQDNDPKVLDELFSAILHAEKLNLMIWWLDQQDPLYLKTKVKIKWGLLNSIIGVAPVDVVQRSADGQALFRDQPIFVTAWDMV
jgi:hypothetical protein